MIRIASLAIIRLGMPRDTTRSAIVAKLDSHLPSESFEINRELSALLLVLEAPNAVERTLDLMLKSPAPREQIIFAYNLRPIRSGWTMELRQKYFEWFTVAANYKGGHSFAGYIKNMKAEAMAILTNNEKTELAAVLNAKPVNLKPVAPPTPRATVREWNVAELAPVVEKSLTKRDFNRGRNIYTQAQCATCHRFDGEGGAFGPDLTGVAGRFNVRDLLEATIEPSKVISDQYQSTILHLSNGKSLEGRIVSETGDRVRLVTDALKQEQITDVPVKMIESREPSKASSMPGKLLDTFTKDEILDLIAYVLSGGDRGHSMFK